MLESYSFHTESDIRFRNDFRQVINLDIELKQTTLVMYVHAWHVLLHLCKTGSQINDFAKTVFSV